MKLSVYTFVKNGLELDFHLLAMLKHHIPFADEIVVAEGYSTDGTYEAIKDLDPKVKVMRTAWDPMGDILPFKDAARRACGGDWCVLLDCDEFIPEWEWDRMRRFLETTDKLIVPMRFHHFYGNYKVRHANPRKVRWPTQNDRTHRNLPGIDIWGDGANVRLLGAKDKSHRAEEMFDVHHFGMVRHAGRLREKWRTQAQRDSTHAGKKIRRRWLRPPGFLYRFFPYNWMDEMFLPDLEVYEGPFVRAVRENPDEFVRDQWRVYRYLKARTAGVEAADKKA